MMSRMRHDVLLVGSIPGDSAEQAMSICADEIGEHLNCLPDGETGNRRIWINFLAATVYDRNPDLETINRPAPVEPEHPQEWRVPGEDWAPRGYEDHWQFKVREGVKEINFPSLGYAQVARDSYETFCRLRDKGAIAAHVRFMVAIPLVESGVRIFISNAKDYGLVRAAYERALEFEIKELLRFIPAEDLAIQWDICMEILAIELDDRQIGLFPWDAEGEPEERLMDSLTHACNLVPEDVLLGCHLCYGDLGHKHLIEPPDLYVPVKVANRSQTVVNRPIDFFHMPVPRDRDDEKYFAPLRDLDIGSGKLFLGLIHHTGGLDGTKKRIDQARNMITGFGIATECGFGRRPLEQMPELLAIHRDSVSYLNNS